MSSTDSSANPQENKGDTTSLGGWLTGKTQGVKNIEAAYSRAGATDHHTPGYASKLGSQDQKGGSENQGVGSATFAANVGDQRAEPSVIGKLFNNMISGTANTK